MPTIIFKGTEACNSNCIYCDVVARKKPITITTELLDLSFERIDEYLRERTNENMEIVWHGGEPLLSGLSFFENVIEYQNKHCKYTSNRVKHAIQSNLTLMDYKYIKILNRLNIKIIGTSYDPHEGVRGFGRNRDSKSYLKLFFKGVNILQQYKIEWGFIYVVTKRDLNIPLDIFYLLSNLKLNGGFSFHPVLLYENRDNNDILITPIEYAEFLGEIFKVWWKNRERYPGVDPFRSLLDRYTNSPEGNITCNDSGACAYSHIYIGPTGELSHCGRSADWNVITYGNIKGKSLIEAFQDPIREQIANRKEILPQNECRNCEYWKICNGGCPMDSWNIHKSFEHKTNWCSVNKVFLRKYFEPITKLKPNFIY